MYERSAIVLERYMEKILKLNKNNNLKRNHENYSELINEIENYQNVTEKELEVIQEFDDTAKEIESLQEQQEELYKANKKLEDERAQLFTELGEEAEVLDIKLKKIETMLEKNSQKLKEIRAEFIKHLTDFSRKQKNRNKCEKARRIGEANHFSYIEKMSAEFQELDVKDVVALKDFINFEKEQIKQEALEIMIKNGKSERVPFNQDVLKRAIKVRIAIAEREAECYIAVYDKMKKLLAEPDTEIIRLSKYKKALRDTSVKLAFLNAEREYIVGFLDYERMTAISEKKKHQKLMMEACNNFELDIMQIEKLYELIMREINNRSTKKGYNQLYNKTYLRNIEDKEKNFKQEVTNVNISMGTVINSNYWRIEGIKNIYNVFQEEVSKKFNRDLSEYKVEELGEIERTKETKKVEEHKNNYNKEEKEEHFKQFKYDEYGKYDEYDYEEDDEEYKEEYNEEEEEIQYDSYEEEKEDEDNIQEYQYKIDDYNRTNKNNNNYEQEDDDLEPEEIYEEEDIEQEEIYEEEEFEEENYEENRQDNRTYQPSNRNTYLKKETKNHYNDDYEEKYEEQIDNYDDEEEYDDYDYDYEEDEDDYSYEEEENDYRAYQQAQKYRKNSYLDDEEDDDEYENIYEYNYDNDEEEYRKQRLQSKTVISFDDEESIDMIIANSRKRSNTRRNNNNKGLFNKLFKK